MPNITPVLNAIVSRISRREIKANTGVVRRATVEYRHAIASLKKQVADLTKRLAVVEKRTPKEIAPPPEVLEKGRLRAMGVKAHRAKLGLSAKDYGKLVGVSGLTIYQWEGGKTKPRQAQKARWLAIRGLGKREAMERLGMAEPKAAGATKPAASKARKRGSFKQTGEEMILSLLKGRKALTTKQLAAAWKKDGRGGTVDNVLSKMVKAGKLRRKPLGGKKGSEYKVG